MTAARPARTLKGTTVRDVMRIHMVTVVPEMTVRELAHTLMDSGVRSVPVLGPTGKILGVASQADVMRAAMAEAAHLSPNGNGAAAQGVDAQRVGSVMGPVGPTVSPDQPVRSLVRLFVQRRVQRALVVENDMLLGIVTPIDVLGVIDEAA
ncbi:MAG TPA: CBS domain-containing protein [Longimicrobium sp.]|nr:CBS domain-containing protein [Longimicrobium sp.]